MTTISALLNQAAQRLQETSDSPSLDAEVLLCLILDKQRSYLRTWPEKQLLPMQITRFNNLIDKRHQGQPVAYLTGFREFWSRSFRVTSDVLIPRPETELIIEASLNIIPKGHPLKVLDIGTGCGVIAISLALERPRLKVTAADSSPAALKIARDNARLHGTNNIKFIESNWFSEIPETYFDIIVSNPPYIAKNDPHLKQGDLRFEPNSALISMGNGLGDIETIVDTARSRLRFAGHLMIEHGFDQQEQVQMIFQRFNYSNIKTHQDLSGLPRMTSAQSNF